jgi:hypothetical protein
MRKIQRSDVIYASQNQGSKQILLVLIYEYLLVDAIGGFNQHACKRTSVLMSSATKNLMSRGVRERLSMAYHLLKLDRCIAFLVPLASQQARLST